MGVTALANVMAMAMGGSGEGISEPLHNMLELVKELLENNATKPANAFTENDKKFQEQLWNHPMIQKFLEGPQNRGASYPWHLDRSSSKSSSPSLEIPVI